MEEHWRPVKDYEGLYEVSDSGNVRSIDRYETFVNKESTYPVVRFRKGTNLHITYEGKSPRVQLSKYHKLKNVPICNLVAEAFIPNPNGYTCVNHKDGNKLNNCKENLEWAPFYSVGKFEKESIISEEWRPIPDYEDLYEVSNTGKVRSIPRKVVRTRNRNNRSFDDLAKYSARELKPCRHNQKTGFAVYHLHRRYKPGFYGQTDTYHVIEDLIQLAFPELHSWED